MNQQIGDLILFFFLSFSSLLSPPSLLVLLPLLLPSSLSLGLSSVLPPLATPPPSSAHLYLNKRLCCGPIRTSEEKENKNLLIYLRMNCPAPLPSPPSQLQQPLQGEKGPDQINENDPLEPPFAGLGCDKRSGYRNKIVRERYITKSHLQLSS